MHDIIEELTQILVPVVHAWKQNHPKDADLVPDSARLCLYEDVHHMGYVIFTADDLGQTMEIRSLAEILACIAKPNDKLAQEQMEEQLFVRITENIAKEVTVAPHMLKCIKLARDFDKRNNTNEARKIEALFNQLMDSFVMRDGNVTDEELAVVQMYEHIWHRNILDE